MHIRPIQEADFPAAAELMRSLSLEFVLQDSAPEAIATFLAANDAQGLRKFAAGGIVYHVAMLDERLVGFVAVREHKHLYHMFVERSLHGHGIGRALWAVAYQCALDAGGDGTFTVNASDFAVPAYEAMGFLRSAPRLCLKGLYANPMRLNGLVPAFVGAA